jgi:hypothetical protein
VLGDVSDKEQEMARGLAPIADLALPHELHKALDDGSDLVCALVGATFIDNDLGHLLKQLLIDAKESNEAINGPNQPLATFSARSRMCYCLGLISKTDFGNIERIREIRNWVAHGHIPVDFTDAAVIKACKRISLDEWRWIRFGGKALTPQPDDWILEWRPDPTRKAGAKNKWRSKFSYAVAFTHFCLMATLCQLTKRTLVAQPIMNYMNFTNAPKPDH